MKKLFNFLIAVLISFFSSAQITLSTYPAATSNNGNAGITFQIVAKKAITLKEIGSQTSAAGTSTYTFWYKIGAYPANPTISVANGWVQVGSGVSLSGLGAAGPPVLFVPSLNIVLPKGTHGIHMTTSNAGYKSWVATAVDTFTDGNITILTGTNIGYGGAGPTPTFHPRQFCGYVTYTLNATGPNDAGVEAFTEPLTSCVGTSPVKARIKNFGKNKIDSVRVHWSVNGIPQGFIMHRTSLDTVGGVGANTAIVTLGNINFVNSVLYKIKAWTEKPNNLTDTAVSNDTTILNLTGRSYPTVDLGNDSSFCPGDTIHLNAGSGNDSIRWSTSATTQTLNVTAVGTYSVKVYKFGCMGGDTIGVGIFPAAPAFTLGPDTTFCNGSSFLLNGPTGAGLSYFWQDSSTNSSYLVDTSGTYKLIVTTINGCKRSDSKLVKLHPLPSVTILAKPSNTVCYNSAYFFEAKGITNGSKMYQWKINGQNSGAQTSNNIFTPTTLMYGDSVTVDLITDICAVTPYPVHTNWITMYLKPMPILINGLKADTVMENTSKNYAIGITPGNTYIWRVFGGTIIGDTTISGVQVNWGTKNSNAWISVQETDVTNCVFDNVLPVNVKSIVGIRENIELSVGLAYPNPADQTVNIPVYVTSEVDLRLSLHDITGKKVMEIFNGKVNSDRTFEVPVAELKEGLYFYKISTSKGYETVQKLTVSR